MTARKTQSGSDSSLNALLVIASASSRLPSGKFPLTVASLRQLSSHSLLCEWNRLRVPALLRRGVFAAAEQSVPGGRGLNLWYQPLGVRGIDRLFFPPRHRLCALSARILLNFVVVRVCVWRMSSDSQRTAD